MGTLVDFRAWLRLDLNDPAASGQRFADADLDRAVTRAAADLTQAWPRVTDTEHVVAAASRSVALGGSFAGILEVEEVEIPYGAAGAEATYPPTLVPFKLSADKASVYVFSPEVPAASQRIRIRWTSAHSITAGSTTVPTELDSLVALGAYGFCALAYSTPAADNFRYEDGTTAAQVDDSMIPAEWRARSNGALAAFRGQLRKLAEVRARSGRRWVSWGRREPRPLYPAGAGQVGVEP